VLVAGYIVVALTGFLLGSIPTGFLVARARGIDIRTLGSGNIGATNVFRFLGVPAGAFVLLADAAKGWIAVWLAPAMFQILAGGPSENFSAIDAARVIGGIAAVLGHNYTPWLGFKGGKGIATSAGVLVALVPWALLVALAAWIIVFATTRYVSLASIVGAFVLPFAVAVIGYSGLLVVVTALMAVLAIYKHKANISRLMSGTESRIGKKSTGVDRKP
jgi:acyl phosphate:glycerol-3-phosphate acyltransferase